MRHRDDRLGVVLWVLLCSFCAWAGQDDPTPDPAETARQRAAQVQSERAIARLLFEPHLSGLREWVMNSGAMKEITDEVKGIGTDRPFKEGEFWFALRLEPVGDPSAGWTRVFKFDGSERIHAGFCFCMTCQPESQIPDDLPEDLKAEIRANFEVQLEYAQDYIRRVVKGVEEAWFQDAVRRYSAEMKENERRRPTPEPRVDDVADAILNGKTRLYRIPHENFDLSTLRRTLLVW